jgi:formylglycine-generating enzyme required for sulfatase activity
MTTVATNIPVFTSTPEPSITPSATSTPILDIGSTLTREKDGMVMVYVPEGPFTMGSNTGSNDQRPEHTVTLDAFWIDQTEVTNAMYTLCVKAGVCDSPFRQNDPAYSRHPVNAHWDEAVAYCKLVGARLPTEAEWEKAARGIDGRAYPWGNEAPSCTLANNYGCVGDSKPVGSYPSGASPYGAYDMSGNVWEWTFDWYDVYPGGDLKASASFGKKYHVLRGGSWGYGSIVRSSVRFWFDPFNGSEFLFVGFRCARDVLP